jgi:hypothetical protein
VPADITVVASSGAGEVVAFVASATDIVDGPIVVNCTPASGSTFAPGTATVNCSATDNAGNTGNGSFTVSVTYCHGDVLQPINNDDSSIFKLGSTVPVKFKLCGASAAIIDLQARILVSKIGSGVTGDEVEGNSTSSATSGNLFRYSTEDGQYIFNWGTKGLSAGTWKIRIDLGDGTDFSVLVSLKK